MGRHPEGLPGLLADMAASPYRQEIRPNLPRAARAYFDHIELMLLVQYLAENPGEVTSAVEQMLAPIRAILALESE